MAAAEHPRLWLIILHELLLILDEQASRVPQALEPSWVDLHGDLKGLLLEVRFELDKDPTWKTSKRKATLYLVHGLMLRAVNEAMPAGALWVLDGNPAREALGKRLQKLASRIFREIA